MEHRLINNRRVILARQFYNEYIDDEYMDTEYKEENDNHLTPFINLCLKHKQNFLLETTSTGKVKVYFNSDTSEKKDTIDEALICIDDIIRRRN